MRPVTWHTSGANDAAASLPLWRDAAARGWIPTDLVRVVIHVQGPADDARLRDTTLSLIAFLKALPAAPRIEIIDGERTRRWPGVERLDLRAHPRYLVEVACLRDGALVPEAWFDDLFLVTIVGIAPDRRLGLHGILAAQGALLDAQNALDLDVAFAAHRLLRSGLAVACGATTYGDAASGSWWAIGCDDVALERAVASHAGARSDELPLIRHFARHELLQAEVADDGTPRLHGYVAPSWRVGLARLAATVAERGRRAVKDVHLIRQNIGRLPSFLQRRVPLFARFGEGGVSKIRMAVIGCGAVSELYHLPAIRRSPYAQLTAVVDADATHAAAIARRFSAPTSAIDYRELPGKIDAALVATPNGSHAEISCFLLEHGIHVLCEKPIATTLADAERMAAMSHRGPARLMVGQSRRFNPNLETLRQLIERGHLGEIEQLSAALGGHYSAWPGRTDYRRNRAAGGGVLMDLGVHLIDLALWLVDRDATVERYDASDVMSWDVETDVEITLRFNGGAQAQLACSYTHGLNRTLRVRGSRGWAETSVDGLETVTFFGHRSRVCRDNGAQTLLHPEADPYERQVDHFASSIMAERPFLVDIDQVVAGFRLIQRCSGVAQET